MTTLVARFSVANLPAIALLEFDSVAAGTFAADAMVKAAPLAMLRVGTIQPGNHLVMVGGGTAEVEIAHRTGMRIGASRLVDEVFLPDAHDQVARAVNGVRRDDPYDSMLVLETSTTAAMLRACDVAVKGAQVNLKELRLGDGLGGGGLAMLTGERVDVEAALDLSTLALAGRDVTLCHSIVSRIDEMLAKRIGVSTRFTQTEPRP